MKYEPEKEVKVFLAIHELGEATVKEVQEYLKQHEKTDLDMNTLKRYLGRWKAKKVMAVSFKEGETLFKLADIPPSYVSGIMAICKGTTSEDMRLALDGLNEELKGQGRIIEPRGVYGGYIKYKMVFETIDPILGGWRGGEDGKLIFPNVDGSPIIPANWFYGWIRDNAALAEMPQSVCSHIAFINGKFIKIPELGNVELKVKIGLANYETIPTGTQFETIMRFPYRGTRLKTEKELERFFKELEDAPLRGFGANPRALGGRIKLVELKAL